MEMTHVETIIVGAGQAGLATSFLLKQGQREHLVLEKSNIVAPSWARERWDSFTLVTPNWSFRMPGIEYRGPNPGGFLARDELVELLNRYVRDNSLPIQFNTVVEDVRRDEASGLYQVQTSRGSFTAKNVVVATGMFQRPKVLPMRRQVPQGIHQLHSSEYVRPDALPEGAVLVVGSSQSGAQIADELNRSGRHVYLSVGRSGRAPRSYRGIDSSRWQELLGLTDRKAADLKSPYDKFAPNPHIAGRVDGGLNLHKFSREGIDLLGTLADIEDGVLKLRPDLREGLACADKFEKDFTAMIDRYAAENALRIPEETLPELSDGYAVPEILEIDLARSGIRTILWANGFEFDFNFVKLPVFDKDGYPIQARGVTEVEGLYFIGLPWLYCQKSGLLSGVGDDADHVVTHLVRRCELQATH